MKSTILLLAALFAFAALALGEETAPVVADAGKYPLSVCPISGEKLGEMGDPVTKTYDGRDVTFCCANCVGTFEKDLKSSFKILDEKIVAAQSADYPLETCVISGEKLGGMGEPYPYVYKNRLVKFCCGNCVSTFEKDPAKYLSMIDAARAKGDAETKE